MKMEILESKETRRQTGNNPWPTTPTGYVSGKIVGKALELKALIQRGMDCRNIEEANRVCDALIHDAETVAMLEQAPLTGGYSG